MSATTTDLEEKVSRFIMGHRGSFEDLALEVFAYQHNACRGYRNLCHSQGVTPDTVHHWKDIPAVPALAFKHLDIACKPLEEAERVFYSSGTTQQGRSRHYMFSLRLYECAIEHHFKEHLLPDREKMPIFVLMPPPAEMPESSLAYMLGYVKQRFGAEGSDHFVSVKHGLEANRLIARLRDLKEAVLLLGTSFSFVHLLDYLCEQEIRLQLPPGSRVMDTGGFKGRSREMRREELLNLLQTRLGIDPHYCINEYGMSEMSSQFYDHVSGEPVGERFYRPPHWVRTIVINPETMREASPGEVGILRHWDLANLYSAMVIQTEDLGVAKGEGFILLGRLSGAERRGCSLAIDELITQHS